MEIKIRPIKKEDAELVIDMMRVFYASPCLLTNGSEAIFKANIDACFDNNIPLDGYVFEDDAGIKGYAMVAKSYSTEFGKPCKWIEDLYIEKDFRKMGIGTKFMDFVRQRYPDSIFRLEVESENENAVHAYTKCGYRPIGYEEMISL